MRQLHWSKTFLRAFKRAVRKNPTSRREIEKTLRRLTEDPFEPSLSTHKLKGELAGTWACSVARDLRILFEFVEDPESAHDAIFLIEIGTHDEVY